MPYNYTLPTNVGLGASAGTATLGGVAHVNTTSAATTGTTEQVLATCTLPANALSANGKGVRIWAALTAAANTNTKTARIRFGGIGGSQLVGITTAVSAANTLLEAAVTRTGASAQLSEGRFTTGSEGANGNTGLSYVSPAADTTATIDIVVTGTTPTAAGDLIFRKLVVEFMN